MLSLYPGTVLSLILFYLIFITILLSIATTIICFVREEIKAQPSSKLAQVQ